MEVLNLVSNNNNSKRFYTSTKSSLVPFTLNHIIICLKLTLYLNLRVALREKYLTYTLTVSKFSKFSS